MNAPKKNYALTEKQVRTISDILSVHIRFFNKTLRPADVHHLVKLKDALKAKELKSSHARPIEIIMDPKFTYCDLCGASTMRCQVSCSNFVKNQETIVRYYES